MSKEFMGKMSDGDLQEMGQDDIERYAVNDMSAGIADIIGVPESVDDLDRNLTTKVMWIEAQTLDGEHHQLLFLPMEAATLEMTVSEYKRLLTEDIMNDAPEPVRRLLEQFQELLDKLKDDE